LSLGDIRGSINDGVEILNTLITILGWLIFVAGV
jgi:hypothetical protein